MDIKKITILFFAYLLFCGVTYSSNKDFVLVIDPGHGGKDPGAVRGTFKEKTINLAVALELGRLIENNMPDVKVVYTRKTDAFVSLIGRSQLANKNKANLFISIHTNSTAAKNTTVSGADTYILGLNRSAENLEVAKRENSVIKYEEDYESKYEGFDPDSPESYIIFEFMTNQYMQQSLDVSTHIQSSFRNKAKRVDRGVRQAGFLVLRESSMPSILIELGFINNSTEAAYLSSKGGQNNMAAAIYDGFRKYKADFDKKAGNPSAQNIPSARPMPTNTAQTPSSSEPEQEIAILATGTDKNAIEYRVQIYYSPNKLSSNSPRFKGLKGVSFYIDKGYKYTVGATTNYDEVVKTHKDVKKKFPDAFVIRMKDGKRIK